MGDTLVPAVSNRAGAGEAAAAVRRFCQKALARPNTVNPRTITVDKNAAMRKGQVKGIGGGDIVAQAAFVNVVFDVAA